MSAESILYILVSVTSIIISLLGAFTCVKKFSSICCTIETTESNQINVTPTTLATLIKQKITPRTKPSTPPQDEIPL